MRMRRTTVNRLLLGIIGLVLLAVGLAVLARGLDAPHHVLLTAGTRRRYRGEDWWWPTVIGVLGVVVVGALWWLLAQLRDRRLRQIHIDSGDGQGAVLRGRALEEIIAAEAERLPGVARAHTALSGRPGTPAASLLLALAPHADPGAVLTDLDTAVLARARTTAALDFLPVEARLRAMSHRAARVS
jgi:hypothetical protein